MDLEDAPLCGVCKHHHHQGSKCDVCGHVGKCHIYPKMKVRATDLRGLKFFFYKAEEIEAGGQWDMLCEMRKMIFCAEMDIPPDQEFVAAQEGQSRHMIAYAGDAPVAVGRYHVEAIEGTDQHVAVVDRLGVLASYRARGICNQSLPALLADIQSTYQGSVSSAIFQVPADGSVRAKVEARGGIAVPSVAAVTRGSCTFISVSLPADR